MNVAQAVGGAAQAPGTQLNIWLITVGEPLPLPDETARPWRTGLTARMLLARGHRVTWWTSSVDHFKKELFTDRSQRRAVAPAFDLQFLHGELYTQNISLRRWRNHRQIAREFRRLAPACERPDVILCSYPTIELSAAAVDYGRRAGVPVLLDIRDLWPDEIAVRLPGLLKPLRRVLLWPMDRLADRALRGATGLIAISDHYLQWGIGHADRARGASDGVFTHGYPNIAGEGGDSDGSLRALGVDPAKRIACFSGTFVGSIDLGTVIEAARTLTDVSNLQFVFAGSGERDAEWRAQAAGLPNVVFTGWLNQQQLRALAAMAWVGLGAYKLGALMSLPNKVFEYMAFGLPVLLMLEGEARALIDRHGCGIPVEPGSPEALARELRSLLDAPARRDEMARRAREAFTGNYSSDVVYARLAAHLERSARQGVVA